MERKKKHEREKKYEIHLRLQGEIYDKHLSIWFKHTSTGNFKKNENEKK